MITTDFDERPSDVPFRPEETSVFIIYTCEKCGWRLERRSLQVRGTEVRSTVFVPIADVWQHKKGCRSPG